MTLFAILFLATIFGLRFVWLLWHDRKPMPSWSGKPSSFIPTRSRLATYSAMLPSLIATDGLVVMVLAIKGVQQATGALWMLSILGIVVGAPLFLVGFVLTNMIYINNFRGVLPPRRLIPPVWRDNGDRDVNEHRR